MASPPCWPTELLLFECPTSDVSPLVSNIVDLRLYAWAEAQLRILLAIVAHKVENAALKRGLIIEHEGSEEESSNGP